MSGFLYEATFDGVRLDVLAVSGSHGRAVVEHTRPKRDGANNEDMGREPFRCTLSLVFIDHRHATEQEGDAQQRFETIRSLWDSGEPRVLVHPYHGAVICRVAGFDDSASADDDGIAVTATFVEEISLPPVFAAGAGAVPRVGRQQVRGVQLDTDQVLADFGFTSSVTQDSYDKASEWEADPTMTTRQVQLEMMTLNNRLNAELEQFEAQTRIDRFPIMKQYTRLQSTLRRAAEAVTTTTNRIVRLTVTAAMPMRIIAAQFYGASQSDQRFAELRDLNPTVNGSVLVPRGTELKAYSPNSQAGRYRQ